MVKLMKIGRDPFGKWSAITMHKDLGDGGLRTSISLCKRSQKKALEIDSRRLPMGQISSIEVLSVFIYGRVV
jgi:hypothetical protein